MVETIAYYTALLALISVPQMCVFWLLIHPFAAWWRRRKLRPATHYLLILIYLFMMGAAIVPFREPLLRVHFGVRWPLVLMAAVSLIAGLYLKTQRVKHLTPAIMLGVPELSSTGSGKLLTDGIYARIRHPRYVEIGFGMLATALFCNYLAIYILLATSIPIFYVVILLEERELRHRFGREYEDYCSRVPRFIPRRRN